MTTAKKAAKLPALTAIKSSMVSGHAYEGGTLFVRFSKGNRLYQYQGVSAEDHAALIGAESFGKHLLGLTKKYTGTPVPEEKEGS